MPVLENARGIQIHGGTFIDASSGRSGIDRLFDYTTPDAAYDSYVVESKAKCLEGTWTQYIEDITSWTISLNQVQQHSLLWMYGPAGVGKSAIAKSCAEETAKHKILGASFFFSRNNGADDPTRFFTTIAHQLAMEIDEYNTILDSKVQQNPALLKKGLEVQFHELIIGPLLELVRRNAGVQRRAVFVNGLDKCNDNATQTKIVELILSSVVTYEDSVPLRWAFFSRPERHVAKAFSRLSSTFLLWKVELPVLRNYDANIRLYFHNSLELFTNLSGTADSMPVLAVWPSDQSLNILVEMVAGLFIYAATIIRFIMDPDALSAQRQLDEVLVFYSQLQNCSARSIKRPAVTLELDAFYLMIMGHIPRNLLPVIQQLLLVHNTVTIFHYLQEPPLTWVLANIVGLTIQELENCLSKLCSILTFRPVETCDEMTFWGESRWPGSARIFFYHASFMEFLLDRERSQEYCIEDQRHYSTLAVSGLRLFKEVHMMNGTPRGEKIQKLHKLLSVFLNEGCTSSEYLAAQNELFYDYLCECTLCWCARAGPTPKVMEILQAFNLAPLRYFFTLQDKELKNIPEDKHPYFSAISLGDKWREFKEPHQSFESQGTANMDISPMKEILTSITSKKFEPSMSGYKFNRLIYYVSKDPERSAYIHSQITQYFSLYIHTILKRAKKLDFGVLNEVELLDYYSYEWCQYMYDGEFHLLRSGVPPSITKVALSPWLDFFMLIEGNDHRLTRAAVSLLNQRRNGDLVPCRASGGHGYRLLQAFSESLHSMSVSDSTSALFVAEYLKANFLRATEIYYTTVQEFLPGGVLFSNLEHITGRIAEELDNHFLFSLDADNLSDEVMQVCVEVLMKDYWGDLFARVEEFLDANGEPDSYFNSIRWTIQFSLNAISRLKNVFCLHVKKTVLAFIVEIEGGGGSSLEKTNTAYGSALINVKHQQMKKAERVSGGNVWFLQENSSHLVDQAFDEALSNHPVWQDAVNELLAEQEGEALRALFQTDDNIESNSESSPVSTPCSTEIATFARDLGPSPQRDDFQSSNATTRNHTAPDVSRNAVEGNYTTSPLQTFRSAVGISTSSQLAPLMENRKLRKRDRLAQLFQRSFKRS